ncbi:MAG: GTPase [Elainellaceae cyanobacterium]
MSEAGASNVENHLEILLREAMSSEDALDRLLEATQYEYKKINDTLGSLNVLVIGKSGVGKSTLLNAVFRENFARTGSGQAITQNTTQYSNEGCPLTIYDSRGIELPNEADQQTISSLKDDILRLIEDNKSNPLKRIDVIWYCVNTRGFRFEQLEEEWVRELTREGIPVILVLTQFFGSADDRKFLKNLKNRRLPIETAIGVMAAEYDLGVGYPTFPARGLDDLVERTAYCLGGEDSVRQLFVQQQLASIDLKEKEALSCVTRYTALTIPAATIPTAGIDSVALWGILSTMISEISSIFGLSPNKDFINTVVNVLTSAGSSAIATMVVPSLLKLFPTIGTLPAVSIALIAFPIVAGGVGTAYSKALKAYLSKKVTDESPSDDEEEKLRARFARAFTRAYQDYVESRPEFQFQPT